MNTQRWFDYRCVCDSTRVYRRDDAMLVMIGKLGQVMPPNMGYWTLLNPAVAEAAIERDQGRLRLVCNEQLDTGRDAPRCGTILYFERVPTHGEQLEMLGRGWVYTPYDYVWKQTWNMTRFLRWESPTYR